jgi:hypothetical protein
MRETGHWRIKSRRKRRASRKQGMTHEISITNNCRDVRCELRYAAAASIGPTQESEQQP